MEKDNRLMSKAVSHSCSNFSGTISVPGDKSISHRSLILGSQAQGTSHVTGLLEGEDVLKTADALRSMGVNIIRQSLGNWKVEGRGIGSLCAPSKPLDLGNSGTAVRLLMGLVAPYNFSVEFTGDKSLCVRPMARVMRPLEQMGVICHARDGSFLPLSIEGGNNLSPIHYELPVASAQVKSAILLAGLHIDGITCVEEPVPTRDHTERMLKGLGANIIVEERIQGGRKITLKGNPDLVAQDIVVPGDPSSAAFMTVAALITKGSDVTIENVCVNPLRFGLYDTLIEMGGDVKLENQRVVAGEVVADIHVKSSQLRGIEVPKDRVSSMIDEFPILAVAASYAQGETIMDGLEELKVKESNRLDAIYEGLCANGVSCQKGDASLRIQGSQEVPGGGVVATEMDHRIAMSFLVMGYSSQNPVTVDDVSMIQTSYPTFMEQMKGLGADIR
jgi:3-phosphoshikimate 1-carboxyvinyltransferase